MQTVTTEHGPVEFPDRAVEAITAHAVVQAELAAQVLQAAGLTAEKPVGLPRSFLLELGAVLELGVWERQGLVEYLDAGLPRFTEAWDGLIARLIEASESFFGAEAETFSRRMLALWFERIAWDAPAMLGADVVLTPAMEPATLDALAAFLLEHGTEILSRLETIPSSLETTPS